MRIHWMENEHRGVLSPKEIASRSVQWNDSGYSSVLLTFNSSSPDNWIKAAAACHPGQKLKYMIALRPYHLSPQYCAMMVEAFNLIDPGRLILNFVAGDVQNRPEEGAQQDVFGNSEKLKTIDDRKKFLRLFVQELISSNVITTKPELVFSGFSEYTVETAYINNGILLAMYDDYLRNIELFSKVNQRMVAVQAFVRDTDAEASEITKIINRERELDYTIYGSKETIKSKLLLMKSQGITDVLIHSHFHDNELDKIHLAIKEILQEGI